MPNRNPTHPPVKVERDDDSIISVSSNTPAPGDTREDAIDIEALEDLIEISPRTWVEKSQAPQKIKSIFSRMFEAVAEDAREDEKLHKDLSRMARIALSEDIAWLMEEHEHWMGNLERAKKARKKEAEFYERMAGKVHVDDEREVAVLVRSAGARLRRVVMAMRRVEHYMVILGEVMEGE